MNPKKISLSLDDLRRQAEARLMELTAQVPGEVGELSPDAMQQALHELRVYQIELELQNEELRRAQAELDISLARYFDLYDLAPVGYCTLSEKGLILEVNLTAAALLKVPRAALVRQPFSRFIPKEDQDEFYFCRKRLFETSALQTCELRLLDKDGTAFWAQLAMTAAPAPDGQPSCRTVLSDISERKANEQAIQQFNEELEARVVRRTRELSASEERMRQAIAGASLGTWEWNVQTGATVFNERWAEMLGYTLEELEPISIETWKRLAHPEDLPLSLEALERCFSHQLDQYSVEHRMRHKSGGWVWVLDSGRVSTWTADGLPLLMLGTHQDITARKRTEADLERVSMIQREVMQIATSFVNVPIEEQDEAIRQSLGVMGRIIDADRAYLFAYDFTVGRLSNTHEWCAEGIVPQLAQLQNLTLDGFAEASVAHRLGKPFIVERVPLLPPEKSLRKHLEPQGIRSLVTLPLMRDGVCLGFVGFDAVREDCIWQDEEIALLRVLAELYVHFNARVAEERATRKLQESLVTARDEAQAATKAKGLFLANMSHEIRTPLNAILGYAQIMLLEDKDSPNSERLNAIARSGEHLLTLINDLLALVRSDARAVTLAPSDFDFYRLLEDVRLISARRLEQSVSFEIRLAEGLPQYLFADQGKIRQILVNLVGNAFKFTHHGWVRMTATVLTGGDPDHLLLAVDIEDTGCGIEVDELEAVFEVFGQSASGRKSGKGTGLGLHLSRRFAQALGGGLTVTSEPGRGSCFRVTFRAGVSNRSKVEEIHCGEVLRLATGEAPCHLLVVDDDPANREMLTMMLSAVGFAVEVADSAGAALRRLGQDTAVTVVLMDKCMPEMDGYEAIKRLRELPASTHLKVLIVTASGFAEERELALAAGADGFVAKPVRRDKLLAEIRRVSGVRYEHEAVPVPLALPSTSLAAIPVALRSHFATALGKGDIRGMRDGLVEIAREHPELAAGLRALVEAYNYVQLQSLLDAANHPPE